MKLTPEQEAKVLALADRINGVAPTPPEPVEFWVSERDFMAAVIKVARENGWKVMHHAISKKSEAGWPDLVCVKNYCLYLECKTESGEPTAAQLAWGEALLAAGQDYRLVRPSDWPEIARVLTEPRP